MPDFAGEIARLCTNIYKQKKGTHHDPELLSATAKTLLNGVYEGYGKGFVSVDWDTPDYETLTRLTQNVFSFSAAKNYQELRTITDALRDGDGNLRTFQDFKEQVAVINNKFNVTWLQTEYDTCIATATQSARWQEFKAQQSLFPYLRYQTAGDDSVRNEHRLLDGITKRVDDPFWHTYYPPNGWNCRCEAIQVPDDDVEETPGTSYSTPPVDPMFRTNCGETGLIFPKAHPYYTGVPSAEIRKAIAYLPPENAYIDTCIQAGGRDVPVHQHVMHGVDELHGNLEVLSDLLRVKDDITEASLLPEIHAKDFALKTKFYPDGWQFHNTAKNADAVLQFGKETQWVTDFKRLEGNGKRISAHLDNAAQQADYAVVKLSAQTDTGTIGKIKAKANYKLQETRLKGILILDSEGNLIYESYKIQPPAKK
ncbi:phage head morphogenesis protein [Bacteroides congonensis]